MHLKNLPLYCVQKFIRLLFIEISRSEEFKSAVLKNVTLKGLSMYAGVIALSLLFLVQ